ncbi:MULTISPECIES: hypothetical protein [unclassified Streptomyces]|uniref:hypothetical protein n=1 Tax=Streptomyces sp. NPDC055082 TaxID=3365718 RepID=UPI0037D7638E
MPVWFLPSTPEEDVLVAYLMKDNREPCWLCKRESRKTHLGYMCWECQESRPIWEAHMAAAVKAEYDRRAAAYDGMCQSCALTRVKGGFECEPCLKSWEV